MNSPYRYLIRISAFLRKEIFEILRQPMLVLTLVLGPFLILFFFGIGFRNEPKTLRTIFVADKNNEIAGTIEEYASSLGPQLVFVELTDDLESAKESLRQGKIDLITIVPDDIYETIRSGEQAVFELQHHEIDPFQSDYVSVFGQVYIDEINRRILRAIASEGQLSASGAQDKLKAARASAAALRELLERCREALAQTEGESDVCDTKLARQHLQDLDSYLDEVELATGGNIRLTEAIEQNLSPASDENSDQEASSILADIIENTNELAEAEETVEDYINKIQILAKLEKDLETFEALLTEFIDLNPKVIVSPFRSQARSIAQVVPGASHFFAPSVIALLLQHLAVTFSSLSMVRERALGTMELFYVSPLSAIETLLGKYLSYLIFSGALAAILVISVVFGMGVPMLGSWLNVGLVLIALLFSSLGVGFVISLVSKNDTQAVQYSMIVLLTSVFFSGFFLSLDMLWKPVQSISWLLPVTYGVQLLRNIMLRGEPLAFGFFIPLIAIGVGLFFIAWVLLRRSMTHSGS